MPYSEVTWNTQDLVTSAKLATMDNNDKARADGSTVADGEYHGHVIYDSGNISVPNASATQVTFNRTFNEIPLITAYYEGADLRNDGLGGYGASTGYRLEQITLTGFYIMQNMGSTLTFRWRAIGV